MQTYFITTNGDMSQTSDDSNYACGKYVYLHLHPEHAAPLEAVKRPLTELGMVRNTVKDHVTCCWLAADLPERSREILQGIVHAAMRKYGRSDLTIRFTRMRRFPDDREIVYITPEPGSDDWNLLGEIKLRVAMCPELSRSLPDYTGAYPDARRDVGLANVLAHMEANPDAPEQELVDLLLPHLTCAKKGAESAAADLEAMGIDADVGKPIDVTLRLAELGWSGKTRKGDDVHVMWTLDPLAE